MTRRNQDTRIVHHTHAVLDTGGALTAVAFNMDSLPEGGSSVNVPAPRAMRLGRIAIASICGADTTPGNWTLRLRVDESGSDSATFSFPLTGTMSKVSGQWSTDFTLQAAQTYHVQADGPSKAVIIIRVTMEWILL